MKGGDTMNMNSDGDLERIADTLETLLLSIQGVLTSLYDSRELLILSRELPIKSSECSTRPPDILRWPLFYRFISKYLRNVFIYL